MRARRTDLWILGGLVLFALVFILGATWLGSKKRVGYGLEPLPPLDAVEAEMVSKLTILTPRYAFGLAWLRADDAERADIEARLPASGLETAVVHLLRGRPSEAVAAARGAADPARGDLDLLLGIALEQSGDRESAITAYQRAESALADDADVLFRLARANLAAGRHLAARAYAERLVVAAPRHAEGQRALGEACLATHDMGRAKRAYLDVLQLRPGDVEAQERVKFLDGTR